MKNSCCQPANGAVVQFMRQFTIRTRMLASIGVLLALLACVGGVGLYGIAGAESSTIETIDGVMTDLRSSGASESTLRSVTQHADRMKASAAAAPMSQPEPYPDAFGISQYPTFGVTNGSRQIGYLVFLFVGFLYLMRTPWRFRRLPAAATLSFAMIVLR